MFLGHCNKSIHHCSVVQEGFGRTDRKVVSLLPGIRPGNVDGRERSVEREGQRFLVARLAVSEPGELLGITEDELQLEPCPVDVEDVTGRERQVCGEEHLPDLSLLVRVKVVNDNNPNLTAKAGVFFPALGMKHGSMPIAMRCPFIGERKWRLNESQSKGFLKFWRKRLSHERPHLAIWVKFMRPEDVR